MRVANTPQESEGMKPSWTKKAGEMALELGLGIGTGIVADRIKKGLISQGPVPAVVGAIAGGATVKSVAKGAIEIGSNLKNDRPWNENVGTKMVDGLRTGAIDAGLAVASGSLSRGVAAKMLKSDIVARSAVTGMVTGTIGGTAHSATNPATWKDGIKQGALRVGVAAGAGAVIGGVLGAGTGWAMKRFNPEYDGGLANKHQVRRLANERGSSADVPMPEGVEAAVANAKITKTIPLSGKLNPQQLIQSPEYQELVKQLKPGDIILQGRGQDVTAWAMKSPYSHAMIVTEVKHGQVKLVEAMEGGVVEGTLENWVKYIAPDPARVSDKSYGFFSVIRPTNDPNIAAKAVEFAKAQIGQPYNYSQVRGKDPGFFCSQLAYEAYDANPAIPKQFKLLQLDSDKARMEWVIGIDREGAVATVLEKSWQGIYKNAPLYERLAMQAKDYGKVVVGAVKEGARRVADSVSADGGMVYPPDYRYGELKSVTPGDLDLADGRKLFTLVFEAIGKKK